LNVRLRSLLHLLVAVTGILSGCKSNDVPAVKPKGNRQVAIHITQAESNSYDTEFSRVQDLGTDVIPLTLPWNTLETPSGFDFSVADIISVYYPPKNIKVSINLTPIYAISRAVPEDLQSLPWDDTLVISRFRAMLDSLHQILPATVINNFIVGVEVDVYLNNHPDEWNHYKTFYDSSRAHIKKLWGSGMPVGVETTWGSASLTAKDNIIGLNQYSDMMVLSYYPNQNDFTVKPPLTVHTDVETIIGIYPSIPVFIVECGYQTSALCNSSEELQRQFIVEMFKLWDDHANKISFMGFLWLTDLSDAVVNQDVVDYGATNLPSLNAFKGYLQTTGLRTYPGTGTDKPGFTQLKSELTSRGW
jgi:hypothetical protein